VKVASGQYGSGEIVLYRSLIGMLLMAAMLRLQGISVRTPYLGLHFWRSASGALLLLAIGLLATAAHWLMIRTRAYGTGATMGVAALQYMGIVYPFILGVWIFDEKVTALALADMGLIIDAGVFATLLGKRSASPKTASRPASPSDL